MTLRRLVLIRVDYYGTNGDVIARHDAVNLVR